MDPTALLADLDEAQRSAVTTESSLVAVIAGAGSGKTRVLTRRAAWRVATGSADEAHTLVLTFTRQAAGELRRRLPRLGLTGRATIGTFHAFAHGLLQQRWRDQDTRPPALVNDRGRVLAGIVPAAVDATLVGDEIGWAAARRLTPAGYVATVRKGERRPGLEPERIAEWFEAYRTEKRRRQLIDLDDMLVLTIEAIERDAAFADTVRWRFRHLLVGEAQDLNPLQQHLVDLLRAGRDDVFLVGDPAQAIYAFNGADPTVLTEVERRYPGVEVLYLPSNHRSTPQIVEAGRHVLLTGGGIGDGAGVELLVASGDDGPAVELHRHDDDATEAEMIARSVAAGDPTLVRTNGIAVLARTNAQLPAIGRALHALGVPVRRATHGADSALHPLLGHVFRLSDSNALRRWAHDALEPGDTSPTGEPGSEPAAVVAAEVGQAVLQYLRTEPTGDGPGFRAWADATDAFGTRAAGVELLSFHAAKGREWHTVHLAGCETSLVPHRSATTAAARAEEARLLYVAITRATTRLAVHSAQRRGGYQRRLSPLLDGFASTVPERSAPPLELPRTHPTTESARLEALVQWRAGVARASLVEPTAICSDAALRAIAADPPDSPAALDSLTGLGPLTSARLFPTLRSWCQT